MEKIKTFKQFITESNNINEMSKARTDIFVNWLKRKIAEDVLDLEEETAIITVCRELGFDIDKSWIKKNAKKTTTYKP